MTFSFFILPTHCLPFNSRRSLIASSSTTGARHFRTNHIPSRLHSLPFSFNFTDIFYSFSCSSGAMTTCIPTPYQHRSLFSTDYDLIVGTQNVYKLPPFKDGRSIRLLRINLVVFPPSFSYAFVSRLVASALARVESLATLCPVSLLSVADLLTGISRMIFSTPNSHSCHIGSFSDPVNTHWVSL